MRFDRFKSGEKYSRSELNRLLSEVERLGKFSVDGLEATSDSSGLHLTSPESGFYAMLLSDTSDCVTGQAYAWEEVEPDGEGSWGLIENARTGTETQNPAYSTKGECLDSGSIVWLKYGFAEEMLFDDCCASSTMACIPYLASSVLSKTLSFSGSGLVSGDSDCSNLEVNNCVQYISDVTCDGTAKTYVTKYLKWTSTGFLVCNASNSSACGDCGSVSACVPFVESAECDGDDFVVVKKFFVWNERGFSVEDDSCPACCYTGSDAIEDVGEAFLDSATIAFTTNPTTISASIIDGSVTYGKIQDISAASRLLGRGDSGSGDVQELSLGTGLAFSGTSLSSTVTGLSDGDKGDITVSSSGTVWTIDSDVVVYSKMQNVSAASRLLGRGDSGSGDVQELSLGTGLAISGTSLSSTVTGLSDGDKGDITVSSSGTVWTIDSDVVVYSKMQNVSAASRLLGRGSAGGSGDVQELLIGTGLTLSGTTLSATASASEASQAEMEAFTATTYVSPRRTQYHPSAAKAWVNFNGTGTIAIRASHNVSSITDGGTGIYTINFTTSFSSNEYCWVFGGDIDQDAHDNVGGHPNQVNNMAAGYAMFTLVNNSGTATDYEVVNFVFYGDQ